ncbi:uncharacterized protein ACO6RY_03278 [Pungitius sinensis]
MDTRFSKRGGKAEENNETNPKLLQAVEEDLAQEFEEVPIQPKKRKPIKYSPRKTMAPTGALELAKLKEQTKMDRQKIEHLEERINYLEEANKDLKADKDFLLAQIKEAPSTLASSGKGRKTAPEPSSSSTSTSTSPSSDSSFLSSSEEEEKKKSKKKKSKKKTKKSKKHPESYSRSRITTTDGVIRRYKDVLRIFKKCGSMKKAFAKMNVDRNTIARTAIIAELAITFRDAFQGLLRGDEDQMKICVLAERCRGAINEEMAETITACKKNGKLLPIMYKYT